MTQPLPSIDFSMIPEDLEGRWVVLRLDEHQTILGQGESPQEAIRLSRVDPSDPRIVVTQVPKTPTAAWMSHSAQPNP